MVSTIAKTVRIGPQRILVAVTQLSGVIGFDREESAARKQLQQRSRQYRKEAYEREKKVKARFAANADSSVNLRLLPNDH